MIRPHGPDRWFRLVGMLVYWFAVLLSGMGMRPSTRCRLAALMTVPVMSGDASQRRRSPFLAVASNLTASYRSRRSPASVLMVAGMAVITPPSAYTSIV